MGERRPGNRPERRVTLAEAAVLLGTSKDAIRMRVRRGSLRSEKGEDGRMYVFVEPDRERPTNASTQAEDAGARSATPLEEELRDQVGYLREQLRREQDAHAEARRIIAGLVQRVPELEASGATEAPRDADLSSAQDPSTPHRGTAAAARP